MFTQSAYPLFDRDFTLCPVRDLEQCYNMTTSSGWSRGGGWVKWMGHCECLLSCRLFHFHAYEVHTADSCTYVRTFVYPGTGFLCLVHNVSKSQAVCGQDAGIAMDKHCPHSQTPRYGTGMLASSTSKTSEGMSRGVVTFTLYVRMYSIEQQRSVCIFYNYWGWLTKLPTTQILLATDSLLYACWLQNRQG